MQFDFSKQPGLSRITRNYEKGEKPLISIITPFYNAGKYFEQTYNCVMNQTFPWFEWIIVNDGSTNKADLDIVERLVLEDSRIKLLHKENGGISTARNMAIREALTEIIIPLDADDLIEPTYVETIYWAMHFNPEYCWCYTKNIGFHNQEYLWDKPFNATLIKEYNFLTYCAGIRKSSIIAVGAYDEITRHYYEDWRLWLKLLSASKKPIKLGYYGFWYRRMDTGVLSIINKDPDIQKQAKQLIEEVAINVDTNVIAKEYPFKSIRDKYKKPIYSNFNRRILSNKTSIMMLIPWMEMGGADIFNLEVVKGLDKEKFEVSILTTVHGTNEWRQKFQEYVQDIFELPSFLDVENYPEFISYFIKSRDIKVILLSNSYYGYYLVPWLRKYFPEIVIIDYVHMEEWYWRSGGYARTSGVVGDMLETTYVCNERTRRVLINEFGRKEDSVKTLYIGVDKDIYNADLVEFGQAKKSLGIAIERPCILYPCRIHPQKRPFLMLEIADRLRKKIEDIAIIVVGDGPQLEELHNSCNNRGLQNTIYFAGQQKDMRPYYRDSDITLICSIKEGLALTAYESCSMSTPVVSSDVGGQAELIDNSVGAILPLLQNETDDLDNRNFLAEEIEQYVLAIQNILSEKENYINLSKNCRQKIEYKFSTKVMIASLQKEIDYHITNEYKHNSRTEISITLDKLGMFADDYVTIFQETEMIEKELMEVWEGKQWLENQYNTLLRTKENSTVFVPVTQSDAEKRLQEIYSMRTWIVIQTYRKFMDNTSVGRTIRRIVTFIGG